MAGTQVMNAWTAFGALLFAAVHPSVGWHPLLGCPLMEGHVTPQDSGNLAAVSKPRRETARLQSALLMEPTVKNQCNRRDIGILSLSLLFRTGIRAAAAGEPPQTLDVGKEEELKMLERIVLYYESNGRKADIPQFWPGWLQGLPPPSPTVILHSAPPIVIFPGFGNDASDYITPKGLPASVGLASALMRRGASAVDVVPIARPDWFNVAQGFLDVNFLKGNAQPEGAAFSWYIKAAKKTVESTVAKYRTERGDVSDARVILLGHSAGGWLARALCATLGEDWVKQNVRGIVTLGAPHASPPPGVIDQTRGTLLNLNNRQPGAYYSRAGVFYVTVSSNRIVGDEAGDAFAREAFTAYNLVIGRGQGVKGDGIVPIDGAFLDGATQLTLGCFHAPSSTTRGADWYGAEMNIDAWLKAVDEQLEAQETNRKV